jgi:hypothetical protein
MEFVMNRDTLLMLCPENLLTLFRIIGNLRFVKDNKETGIFTMVFRVVFWDSTHL